MDGYLIFCNASYRVKPGRQLHVIVSFYQVCCKDNRKVRPTVLKSWVISFILQSFLFRPFWREVTEKNKIRRDILLRKADIYSSRMYVHCTSLQIKHCYTSDSTNIDLHRGNMSCNHIFISRWAILIWRWTISV